VVDLQAEEILRSRSRMVFCPVFLLVIHTSSCLRLSLKFLSNGSGAMGSGTGDHDGCITILEMYSTEAAVSS
jgi:hypothetical protein